MKVSALAYAAILGLAFAGTAMAQRTPPSDTGSMAFPAPLPQGNVGTSTVPGVPGRRADTGSMAYPSPERQGSTTATPAKRRRAANPTDTGSMAYPAPLPQGNLGTTRTR